MDKAAHAIARILELRFGKAEAQALIFGRARLVRKDVQFMDVKHLSELCERYRGRVRREIAAYRGWQATHAVETDAIARLYSAAEGDLQHRRVADAVRLWFMAHRDYHLLRRTYLMQCMGPRVRVDWDKAA